MSNGTQTFFGNINAIVAQSAGTAVQIKEAVNAFKGQSPVNFQGINPFTGLPYETSGYSNAEKFSIVALVSVLALIVFLVVREGRGKGG